MGVIDGDRALVDQERQRAVRDETIILEDGETYDYENEEVIRADTNQPPVAGKIDNDA